jgi:general secretion pathway protein G
VTNVETETTTDTRDTREADMQSAHERGSERRAIRRRARRRRREGMTLVEIMIVVIIMALIATAVGVAVIPQLQNARVNQTRSDAQSVQSAAVLYYAQEPGAECPNVAGLVEAGVLDRSRRTTDAWDNEFVIECEGNDIWVWSHGPDGQAGTEDDIRPN